MDNDEKKAKIYICIFAACIFGVLLLMIGIKIALIILLAYVAVNALWMAYKHIKVQVERERK